MSTVTVRASEHSHKVLQKLSEQVGVSLIEALDIVIVEWEKASFFRSLNESFAALRSDADAWAEELEERRLWDLTAGDDITDDFTSTSPKT